MLGSGGLDCERRSAVDAPAPATVTVRRAVASLPLAELCAPAEPVSLNSCRLTDALRPELSTAGGSKSAGSRASFAASASDVLGSSVPLRLGVIRTFLLLPFRASTLTPNASAGEVVCEADPAPPLSPATDRDRTPLCGLHCTEAYSRPVTLPESMPASFARPEPIEPSRGRDFGWIGEVMGRDAEELDPCTARGAVGFEG